MSDETKIPGAERQKTKAPSGNGNLRDIIARAQAALEHRPKVLPESLNFRWKSANFTLQIVDPEHAAFMRLTATLGYLPYSAEDRTARQHTVQLLFKFNQQSTGRFSIGPDGAIAYGFSILREKNVDLESIMNTVAVRLMTMSDMFESLSQKLVENKNPEPSSEPNIDLDSNPPPTSPT